MLLGQSNMVGMRSKVEELPAHLTVPQTDALYFKGGAWVTLQPGVAEPPGIGPELSFANRMTSHGKIGIIKVAEGNTTLYTQWNPAIPGALYSKTIAAVADAAKTRPIKVAGVLWMQGESDGATQVMADSYAANFVALVAALRRDLNTPDLPVTACRETAPADQFPYTDVVRAAQASAPIVKYRWFDCDGLSKGADNLHYDTAGQVKLGELFADAITSLTAAP
nr:sialate O-acetylesterase [Cupriavidus gilardii]